MANSIQQLDASSSKTMHMTVVMDMQLFNRVVLINGMPSSILNHTMVVMLIFILKFMVMYVDGGFYLEKQKWKHKTTKINDERRKFKN